MGTAAGDTTPQDQAVSRRPLHLAAAALLALIALTVSLAACSRRDAWNERELETLRSLSLSSLPALPADPSNAYAGDPRAADLGHRLFFDTRLSANGQVACATCHLAELNFTDGKPLGEVYPDSGRFAAATGFWTHAAEPSFIPGLVDVLIGMKAGDNRALAVKFPKDFALESLRGVKAAYSLTVQAVRAALPPDDGELVKQVGIESMDELRRRLRENLEQEAARAEEQRQRQEISDYLLKKADFPLPQSVVAQETQRVLRQMLGEIGQRPGASEFVEKNRETLLSNASQAATTRVRLSTILGAIAAAEKIEATEAEINAELAAAASYYASRGEKDMTPAKLRERMEESGGLQQVAHEIRDGKVMKWLLDDAKA